MARDHSGIRRLILASGSPRRRQLLSLLGLPFVIKACHIDERQLDGEPPAELVTRVSQAKARAVSDVRPDELVVAADTIVVLDGTVLGKPNGADEAVAMLRHLRGRAHTVLSGVAVWHPDSRRMMRELGETSELLHRQMGDYARAAGIDRFWGVGPELQDAVAAFGSGGRWFADREEVLTALDGEFGGGDTVLVKGSRSTRMEQVLQALLAGTGGGEN